MKPLRTPKMEFCHWTMQPKSPHPTGQYQFYPKIGKITRGGFSNSRFVLKPDVAIASEVSTLSKNSLAITDFHAKKTQHVQLFENPLPGTPPHSRFPRKLVIMLKGQKSIDPPRSKAQKKPKRATRKKHVENHANREPERQGKKKTERGLNTQKDKNKVEEENRQ